MLGLSMFAALPMVVEFRSTVRGEGPVSRGVHTLFWTAVPMIGSPLGGRLGRRLGAARVMPAGLGTITVGLAVVAAVLSAGTPALALAPGLTLIGAGIALVMPNLAAAGLAAVSGEDWARRRASSTPRARSGRCAPSRSASRPRARSGRCAPSRSASRSSRRRVDRPRPAPGRAPRFSSPRGPPRSAPSRPRPGAAARRSRPSPRRRGPKDGCRCEGDQPAVRLAPWRATFDGWTMPSSYGVSPPTATAVSATRRARCGRRS